MNNIMISNTKENKKNCNINFLSSQNSILSLMHLLTEEFGAKFLRLLEYQNYENRGL